MSIPILIEPALGGFRAAAGGPLDLSAEATSVAEAVAALRSKIASRLSGGAILIEQSIATMSPPIPVVPLAENPLFDNWLAAIDDYRNEQELREQLAENTAD
ncbi:MAG TPA: hypothetical protein VHR66_00900 [Gemmataceae bacterium]|jgi:hypothetical protein|nr:hypothetical protein [Gemmataceae bacterium]